MVAQGKVQTAKELLVGDVSLSFKYKYSAKVMEVDATWDIKPARAASTSMWVAIFKEGAPLTEVCMCVRESVCEFGWVCQCRSYASAGVISYYYYCYYYYLLCIMSLTLAAKLVLSSAGA
jgi:hypothetical protein